MVGGLSYGDTTCGSPGALASRARTLSPRSPLQVSRLPQAGSRSAITAGERLCTGSSKDARLHRFSLRRCRWPTGPSRPHYYEQRRSARRSVARRRDGVRQPLELVAGNDAAVGEAAILSLDQHPQSVLRTLTVPASRSPSMSRVPSTVTARAPWVGGSRPGRRESCVHGVLLRVHHVPSLRRTKSRGSSSLPSARGSTLRF